MSAFVPTTRLTVQRGVAEVDQYGDELPSFDVVRIGLPAAVTESSQRSYQGSDQRGGVVEDFTIRLRPNADVVEEDRLVDERTGAVYQVRSVSIPQSVVGRADVRVTAVRTAAASQPVNG